MTQLSTTLMPFFTVITAARGLTVNSSRLVVRGPCWMPTCGLKLSTLVEDLQWRTTVTLLHPKGLPSHITVMLLALGPLTTRAPMKASSYTPFPAHLACLKVVVTSSLSHLTSSRHLYHHLALVIVFFVLEYLLNNFYLTNSYGSPCAV